MKKARFSKYDAILNDRFSFPSGSGITETWKPVSPDYGFCNHKPSLVVSDNGVNYWGATISDIRLGAILSRFRGATLLVNLSGVSYTRETILTLPLKLKGYGLETHSIVPNPDYMSIEWGDGECPPLGFSFWEEYRNAIRTAGYKNVIAYCIGGHGRTGTFLASILLSYQGGLAESATATVRMELCSKCIETREQNEYLHGLANYYRKQKQEQET